MDENGRLQKLRWRTVISALTALYALLHMILYFNPRFPETIPWPGPPNVAACSLLAAGAVGAALRRRWAVLLLVSGATLGVAPPSLYSR